ncbi:glycoside hydrolase superfamily [Radiomyces spectabilis]|uniref:glycoside hydrolase superfamily n=1 Tax=Radiomyces spectabilis TaxID=64574 RepID=UPI00221F7312|nr:glycoside hydrolase superfamily [Radiomyces spectabilis]KAI8393935.1 glycoside hydrolase superfamily [Radiomyces spectabilis]
MLLLTVFLVIASFAFTDAHVFQKTSIVNPFDQLTVTSILENHHVISVRNAHKKLFPGPTLAYVTPWNNCGYNIAKIFKGKFDYLSPVWFYIEPKTPTGYVIEGEHDVDSSWIQEVRGGDDSMNISAKVVPRFQCRSWSTPDWYQLASNTQNAKQLANQILKVVIKYDLDGIVLECAYPSIFPFFVQRLSETLRTHHKTLVAVLPPIRNEEQKKVLNAQSFAFMAKYIDYFSLMTYDYSTSRIDGGPAAPVDWIIDNIEYLTTDENRHQLLMGMPMYAVSYAPYHYPEPLGMETVLRKLQEQRQHNAENQMPVIWDPVSEEHWFKYMINNHRSSMHIWMPSLTFIRQRLAIAKRYGIGVALWEIGQGLDYFYDLF